MHFFYPPGQTRDLLHSCCNFGCTPLYPLGSRIQVLLTHLIRFHQLLKLFETFDPIPPASEITPCSVLTHFIQFNELLFSLLTVLYVWIIRPVMRIFETLLAIFRRFWVVLHSSSSDCYLDLFLICICIFSIKTKQILRRQCCLGGSSQRHPCPAL